MPIRIAIPFTLTLFAGFIVNTFAEEPLSAGRYIKPNVLFISIDDLNDWIGCLGGHPQTRTPNIDRLAKRGVLFTNAHCPAPSCSPSRASIFTGVPPFRSGLYHNGQKIREVMPQAELIPRHFSKYGYWSAGAGKLLHYIIDPPSWDDYFPAKQINYPIPTSFDPPNRPINLPLGGSWHYSETDWAALNVSDENYGGDWLVTKWIGEQLQRKHDKPIFLACGIYRPHEPWFVPAKYFEPFPLETIQLGPGFQDNDLEDVPPAGQKIARNRYFEHILKQGQLKKGIQAYLASIHFADAMLGRVLDALDKSPYRDNTIIVLWSDNGWQLGEKEHWMKFTGWRMCTRVPLVVQVPKGTGGMPGGTMAGTKCDKAVSLTDLFPTLTELCGLPATQNKDASVRSLVPLLRNPQADWPHAAVTQLARPNSYAISQEYWRYIHYANGDEELYDVAVDPYEHTNLLLKNATSENRARASALRAYAPANPVPIMEVPLESLPELIWRPAGQAEKNYGEQVEVAFVNTREQKVELFRIATDGKAESLGIIEPAKAHRQKTHPGDVWEIRLENGTSLGNFVVGDRAAKAVIPKEQ